MQLTLAQLMKLQFPYSHDEEMDLSENLDGFEDILHSTPAKVHTVIRERGTDTYLCEFHISIDLTLEDSVSLKEIPYTIDTDASELFTTDPEIEDATLIEGITLNTREAVLMNILSNKPMSTTREEFESDPEPGTEEEEGEKINPAFASLKDLL